ncbi:MAG: hypothetical protein K0R76_868, partial [Alphaproteobacteria bacterium]|nr:hypothetical protein [Alphaproteobacteria bacterium]
MIDILEIFYPKYIIIFCEEMRKNLLRKGYKEMKLYLKTTAILVLALTLTPSATFSMEIGEYKNPSDASETPLFAHSDETIIATLRTSPLFSAMERDSVAVGLAVLGDRIEQNEALTKWLSSSEVPAESKIERSLHQFGDNYLSDSLPRIPHITNQEEVTNEEKINSYRNYIFSYLNIYTSMKKLLHQFITASTQEEKHLYQDTLYNFLSFQKKYYEEYLAYTDPCDQIRKRSLEGGGLRENDFFELISLKTCAKPTKLYGSLNEYNYIKISFPLGLFYLEIDNKMISKDCESKNQKLVRKFELCPFFGLASDDRDLPNSRDPISKDIKEFSKGQLEAIEDALLDCHREEGKIGATLIEEVGALSQQVLPHDMKNSFVYNESGLLVLKAIQAYEAVSEKIRQIEKDTIEWLKKFKGESKLYRTLPLQYKHIITTYLQDAANVPSQRKRQKKQKQKQKQTQEQEQTQTQEQTKQPASTQALPPAREELNQQNIDVPIEVGSENGSSDAAAAPASPVIEPGASSQAAASIVQSEPPVVPVKVKQTRRTSSVKEAPVTTAAMKKDEENVPMLPETLRTAEFRSSIQALLAEKNPRKVISLFNKLNNYGIFAETDERNNKGYFAIKSFLSDRFYARTYHHSHTENPHG